MSNFFWIDIFEPQTRLQLFRSKMVMSAVLTTTGDVRFFSVTEKQF